MPVLLIIHFGESNHKKGWIKTMMQIFKNLKKKKCDACSVTYDENFNVMFGHNPNRQQVATFCEGCLSDLKEKLEKLKELEHSIFHRHSKEHNNSNKLEASGK